MYEGDDEYEIDEDMNMKLGENNKKKLNG